MKTLKEHFHELPFRLLLLNLSDEEQQKIVKDRRAVCVNSKIFNADSKDKFLENCWQQWLGRFEEKAIDLRIFFEQKKGESPTEEWEKQAKSINIGKPSIDTTVCYHNEGTIQPPGQLNDNNKYFILYDRHAKLADNLKVQLLKRHFYEQIDKNSADFDLLFNAKTDQNPFLLLYELVEAGLMKILILDERVAEASTEIIYDMKGHYSNISNRGFRKYDGKSAGNFTRFDACWAAGIYLGTHISLDSDKPFIPLKNEIDSQHNHFLKIRFVKNEATSKIELYSLSNIMEWNGNKWSDNLWKDPQENVITIPPEQLIKLKIDCIVIHRTKLKELFEYWKEKEINFLDSLNIPKIIVTTGGGTVDFIDSSKWRILPTNAIKDYVLGSRPAKLNLTRRLTS